LCSGAALYVEPRERLHPGPDLERYLEREKITVLSMTPSALALMDPAAGPSLEQVIVGGEPCPEDLARRWAGRCRLFNAYGPTEASITTTYSEYRDGLLPPLIGRPLPNVHVYLLDEAQQPVPVGAAGELCIGGVAVARGYLNRPELTAERFIADPFSGVPGATMYRSGDFGRRRADGQIEFIGRRDDQVKIRGFRVELGEIEAAIARHPAVRQVSVIAREDNPGDKRLVAYVASDRAADSLAGELRTQLRATLPEHMVPAHFVALPALPLTQNGKVDRKALPAPGSAAGAAAEDYVAPRNDLEIGLATVWARVLGVPRVGISDNFFDHGGNSLLVVKLLGEMERMTGLRIGLGEFFKAPTIAGLVEGGMPGASRRTSVVVPLQPDGDGTPVFCICGVNIYKDFAQSLGTGQPVYGVYVAEEQAIVDQVIRGEKPTISIELLVDAYYHAIARFRPEGPYRLAGLSFGGILAMELAAKMRRQGAAVDVVLLLDAALPDGLHRNWGKWLSYQTAEILKGNGAVKLRRLLAKVHQKIGQPGALATVGEQRYEGFAARQQAAFMSAAAQWTKTGPAYDFRAVLFRASDASVWGVYNDLAEDYGWRRYLGDNLLVVDAVGGHRSIIEPPHVTELGRKARAFLAADSGGPSAA
jgi:thioesterase domain-containing protein